MSEKTAKGDYSALPQFRVCFACGRVERVDFEAEDSPVKVKRCEDCGSRMYMMNGVEAYFDRFLSDRALSDDVLSTLSILDTPGAEESAAVLGLSVAGTTFDLGAFDTMEKFSERLKRTLDYSPRHAMRMARVESDLVTREWKSRNLGVFRPYGRPASTAVESMFLRGRFTLEDARAFDAKSPRFEGGEFRFSEGGREYRFALKPGVDPKMAESLSKSLPRERRFALMASACVVGEETVSSSVNPGYAVGKKGMADLVVQNLKQFDAGEPLQVEVSGGRLVLKGERAAADRALSSAGMTFWESGDGAVSVDLDAQMRPALQESLLPVEELPASAKAYLSKDASRVLDAMKKASDAKGAGSFVTVDDVKTVGIASLTKAIEELERAGAVVQHGAVPGWAYTVSKKD